MKHAWVDNSSAKSTEKKSGSSGDKREGNFSKAGEQAKKAFFSHREEKGDRETRPTNLQKKMQSGGG
jgi:hypothetical protein